MLKDILLKITSIVEEPIQHARIDISVGDTFSIVEDSS